MISKRVVLSSITTDVISAPRLVHVERRCKR
jgi:hypothetical protein